MPAVGVVERADDPFLAQAGVLFREQQVHQEADGIAWRVVVARGLVGGLVEFADDELEGVAHVGVGHDVRMEVDRSEGLDDLAQELGLLEGQDLLFEVEVLEDVDVR